MLGSSIFSGTTGRKDLQAYIQNDPDLHGYYISKAGKDLDDEDADRLYREYSKWRRRRLDDEGVNEFLRDAIARLFDEAQIPQVPHPATTIRFRRGTMHWPWSPGLRIPFGDARDKLSSDDLVAAGSPYHLL